MKSILEEFWYGNIDPQVDATSDNKEVKNLLALMMRNWEKLSEKLNDEEKETLEKYDDCIIEMNSLSGTLYFTAPKELLHYADGITSLGEAKHHFLFTAKLPEAHIFGSFTVIRCFRGLPFV